MNQTPDEIMEAAKQKAALKPNEQISVKLNETEYFAVTYSNERDTFDCSRTVVGSSRLGKQMLLVRKHENCYLITNGKGRLTNNPTFDNPVKARDVETGKRVELYFNENGSLVSK